MCIFTVKYLIAHIPWMISSIDVKQKEVHRLDTGLTIVTLTFDRTRDVEIAIHQE